MVVIPTMPLLRLARLTVVPVQLMHLQAVEMHLQMQILVIVEVPQQMKVQI